MKCVMTLNIGGKASSKYFLRYFNVKFGGENAKRKKIVSIFAAECFLTDSIH